MIFTIGHSKLDQESFESLIANIDEVWDVRSHPGSKWPQFNKEFLENWLPSYRWVPELGGWREKHLPLKEQFRDREVDLEAYAGRRFPKQRIAGKKEADPASPSWYSQGLWDFQWFMTLPEFLGGVDELVEAGRTRNVGIMCCEVLWWKCHRSMIADCLHFRGIDSVHLQPKLTKHSRAVGNRIERYHPDVLRSWREWSPGGDRQEACRVPVGSRRQI